MKDDPIVIASTARTPMGGFMCDLKSLAALCIGGGEATAVALERLD